MVNANCRSMLKDLIQAISGANQIWKGEILLEMDLWIS